MPIIPRKEWQERALARHCDRHNLSARSEKLSCNARNLHWMKRVSQISCGYLPFSVQRCEMIRSLKCSNTSSLIFQFRVEQLQMSTNESAKWCNSISNHCHLTPSFMAESTAPLIKYVIFDSHIRRSTFCFNYERNSALGNWIKLKLAVKLCLHRSMCYYGVKINAKTENVLGFKIK